MCGGRQYCAVRLRTAVWLQVTAETRQQWAKEIEDKVIQAICDQADGVTMGVCADGVETMGRSNGSWRGSPCKLPGRAGLKLQQDPGCGC